MKNSAFIAFALILSFISSNSFACKRTASSADKAYREAIKQKITTDPVLKKYEITKLRHKSKDPNAYIVTLEKDTEAQTLTFRASSQADCSVVLDEVK